MTTNVATLDRQTRDYAVLVVDDGRTWDVYGDTWQQMKEEAEAIARMCGASITAYNFEYPEQ